MFSRKVKGDIKFMFKICKFQYQHTIPDKTVNYGKLIAPFKCNPRYGEQILNLKNTYI